MSITFSSCFYILKSKFETGKYIYWMNNFISIVNHFNLVIYTDINSVKFIDIKNNPKIKIVIKPFESFYNYKYKENWIENHKKNVYLNKRICWELNMLWNEKIWFVKDTIEQQYFETDMYGWCDIGYFRNRVIDNNASINDLHTIFLKDWCHPSKIQCLDTEKIHYACVNNDNAYIYSLKTSINAKNSVGLPHRQIIPNVPSIGGGFFILHKDKIEWWSSTFENKLQLYFKHHYLVKDDQIILADCIFSDHTKFLIYLENSKMFDNWFMFQRFLNLT